jgi:hypothetical protein
MPRKGGGKSRAKYGLQGSFWTFVAHLPFLAFGLVIASVALLMATQVASRSTGMIRGFQKISDTEGNFLEVLDDGDEFGIGVDAIGDLDDDGVTDFVVGAWEDDDGGVNFGAVYILFMNSDGTVRASQKISMTTGGFTGPIDGADNFGFNVSGIGDLDGDDVPDIAVGERGNDDGGTNRGALYILFLNTDGTVKAEQRISDTAGGFLGVLDDLELFGECVERIDDYNGDLVDDLVVCASQDDDGGTDRGAFWILHMNTDGTVAGFDKVSQTSGLTTLLDDGDRFGKSFTVIPDVDGNGVDDWAVGVSLDDDGGNARGAVYLLFMDSDGSIMSEVKISDLTSGFSGALSDDDRFGSSIAAIEDLDGDGIAELLVGSWLDDDGGSNRGAFYIIFLNADGSVKRYQKVSDTEGDFTGVLDNEDSISVAGLSSIGDFNRDGAPDVVVSAFQDDDGGVDRGAIWIMYLEALISGGRNYVFPRNVALSINDGALCTTTRNVTLTLQAYDATRVVVGHDAGFINRDFTEFDGPVEQRDWVLSEGAGTKLVYALFQSRTNELSGFQVAEITYDPVSGCK